MFWLISKRNHSLRKSSHTQNRQKISRAKFRNLTFPLQISYNNFNNLLLVCDYYRCVSFWKKTNLRKTSSIKLLYIDVRKKIVKHWESGSENPCTWNWTMGDDKIKAILIFLMKNTKYNPEKYRRKYFLKNNEILL